MKKGIFDAIFAVCGGGLVYCFGGWDAVLITLCVFMAADYLTGLIKAGITRAPALDSRVGFNGLLKKILILICIMVAVAVDRVIGQNIFRPMACMFFIANEGISILENIAACGVPLPPALLKMLQKMKATAEQAPTAESTAIKDPVYKPPAE